MGGKQDIMEANAAPSMHALSKSNAAPLSEYASLPQETVMLRLGTSQAGLSHDEARKRREKYGFNEPVVDKEPHIIIQILAKFKNPLILMLLAVAGVSLLMGQGVSAALILIMALVSVLLSFQQEYRAGKEAKKLSEMVSNVATVIRSGAPEEIDIRMLVPGDIVDLSAGDLIPADIRIISEKDLYIDQASLTGESFPVEKTAQNIKAAGSSITSLTNIAFMGSHVISGSAIGVVISTGSSTQFGELVAHSQGQYAESSFDKGISGFVMLMIRFVVVLVVVIFGINAALKGNMIEALLFSLAVAVGLTPEMLSMIITVNLSNGAIDMSKKRVIVKKLSAIQNFGAMDILCTDKTGTLTLGEVVLERYFDLAGKESDEVLSHAYANSFFQTGLRNLLDEAILRHDHPSIAKYRKVDEIPFDFQRRMMSVVVEKSGRHIIITKGAPEEIARRCSRFELGGKISPIHGKIRKQLLTESERYEGEGFRVLAIAYKNIDRKRKAYSKADEHGLILKGFVIFLDPPKPSARKTIETLENDGIKLKVLTGDNELIARKVCSEVGMDVSGVATGDMVDKLSDEELGALAEKVSVFARLSPLQKERIILALKKRGHTVGYLGDGINDAPSFKAADVGISVANAADIAKETASIILLKKSLVVLHDGVIEGRRTYANILKYIKMGASSNFGNMVSVTGASLFLKFLPMQPIQILLNNFLYDMSQVAIPTDNVDAEYLVKPTPWKIEYIKKVMVYFGPISSLFDFLTFGVLLLLGAPIALFNTVWFLESLATQTLVIHVIRTSKVPFLESMPSKMMLVSTIGIVIVGFLITISPLAPLFGFVRPTLGMLAIVAGIVATYLVLVQLLKTWFLNKYGYE